MLFICLGFHWMDLNLLLLWNTVPEVSYHRVVSLVLESYFQVNVTCVFDWRLGSLDTVLFDINVKLSDEQKIRFVRGIALGMLHLHEHNIVHRDLAARNILLTGSGDPKISVRHFYFPFSMNGPKFYATLTNTTRTGIVFCRILECLEL